jgi:flagellar biosynthesis/type III secretory pathway M-ring protein FliF/YscJ
MEQAKIPAYQQSIMSVVGLKEAALVAITFMPTRKPVGPPLPSFRESFSDFWERWGGTLVLGGLILIALLIVYRLLRAALPKTAVEDIELLRQKLAEDTLIPSPPEVVMAEEEFGRVKQSVREMVAKNPRNVASIMKQWMAGK